MNINPICPHCLIDIEYDDLIDNSYGGSRQDSKWTGHCPFCGRKFVWNEVYLFDRIEEFEEEINNG